MSKPKDNTVTDTQILDWMEAQSPASSLLWSMSIHNHSSHFGKNCGSGTATLRELITQEINKTKP